MKEETRRSLFALAILAIEREAALSPGQRGANRIIDPITPEPFYQGLQRKQERNSKFRRPLFRRH